ncbi:MAG: HAMP domain-containing protein [Desulfobacteraceae bacterium]|nr:HAMP domain-containing protein [Desulfobacteraceae bacterium]
MSKVLIVLMSVFVLYTAAEYAIQRFIIFPSFISLEQDEGRKDTMRAVQAINREAHHLDSLCNDWAAWDDSYEFVQAPSKGKAYIEANLMLTTFTGSNLNLIYIVNSGGKVVWGQIHDLEAEKMIRIPEFPNDAFPKAHPLTSYIINEESPEKKRVAGVFMTGKGPMLVSAHPILNSAYQGPSRGTIILGRLLNEKLVNTFIEQTNVKFQVFPIHTTGLPEDLWDIPGRITRESPFLMNESGDGNLIVYTTFPDIQGNAVLLLKTKIPRKISERGVVTTRVALISIIASGGGIILVILLLLRRIVLKPLSDLTDHTLSIAESGDLSARTAASRSDEIGVLSREFDKMLARLADAQKKLMEQSYYSGKAEMASGILHNVRNSMSPLLGQLHQLDSTLRKIPFSQLEMAHNELDEGTASEQRRQDLIKFVLLSNKSLISSANDSQVTLGKIAERIGHVEQILDDHQQWGHGKLVEETIPLEELVRDAVLLMEEEFPGAISTHFDPGLAEVGAVIVHRLSFLQVLGNLWRNAAEAIQRKRAPKGEIHIQASIENTDSQALIHVQVRDNGVGIEADNLRRIFEQGFSTKKENASGIGLHWCANTLSVMRGRIYAESDGPDKGACLHLMIPAHSDRNQIGSDGAGTSIP